MKRYFYFLAIFLLGLILAFYFIQQSRNKTDIPDSDFRLIVKFNKNISDNDYLTVCSDDLHFQNIKKHIQYYGVKKIQAVFRNRYTNEGKLKLNQINTTQSKELALYYQILIDDKEDAQELAEVLKREGEVELAYIEYPINIKPSIVPNDTQYGSQWHLKSLYNPLADIDAEQAWDINTGRSDVIIAVCDGGVDYLHPDLDPGDRSRIIMGYDSGNDDNDPMDDLPDAATLSFAGHGTHVAGIIGAITNNNTQVSGIMWNCKIMPVKMVGSGSIKFPFIGTIWDFSTTAFPSDVADAIDYAVNNGAHIINLSYGFNNMGSVINDVILAVPLLYNTILNAYNQNVVIIAAMGNEFADGNPVEYPAAFPEVIAVGATDLLLQKADFSNTGNHIDISAPGTGIFSTTRGGSYGANSGTSMSAPIVSGIAGLIISQGLDRNFDLTNDDVKHILEVTADDVVSYGLGWDDTTGYGKVNARKALELLDQPNTLYHSTSYGGSSSITNLNQWNYIGGRWGLSSGIYYDVDQYEITKHITFDISFCDIPEVWIRDRECMSMSFANPNDGRPYAQITNVTETGFDIRYASYYVRTNSLGQTVNMYIPASPSSTKIEYTVVGEPDFASTVGPISGPSSICTSNSTYTINNLPSGSSVNWTHTNNLSYVSGQGTANYTVNAISNSIGVPDTITATISNVSCQDVIIQKEVYLSPNFSNFDIEVPVSPINGNYDFVVWASGLPSQITNYNWTVSNGYIVSQDLNEIIIHPTSCTLDPRQRPVTINVSANNSCGSASAYTFVPVDCDGGGINPLSVQPNPANEYIDAEIIDIDPEIDNNKLQIKLFNYNSIPVYTGNSHQKSFRINTNKLPRGLYVLQVIHNGKVYSKQVLIEH